MKIRLTIPGEPTAETLGIALEAATRLAQHDVASGRVPSIEDAISDGLRWQPEPPGDESFDRPADALARGWGDCDDLAPWLAAEMREQGYDDGAEAFAVRSGPQTWHALVRGSDGTVYDPSRWAGMPYDVVGQCMPCTRPVKVGKPSIVIGQRSVRVDMPGLQARRGCQIGTAHECACDATDEDRVLALIHTIEDAIATAQMARTGDARALKSLAVIYRVLRGDDPDHACAGLNIRREHVGMDFDASHVRRFVQMAREILATAADELFNGETWTTQGDRIVKARKVAVTGHRMGIIPCMAALAPIASAAITAGTIAAVIEPLATMLQKMVGSDSDFGKAMNGLKDILGPIKLVSAAASGIEALAATASIPIGAEAVAARWYETLRSPLEAAGVSGAATKEVASTLGWLETGLAKTLPASISTSLAPEILDVIVPYAQYAAANKFDPSNPLSAIANINVAKMGGQVAQQLHDVIFQKLKDMHLADGLPAGMASFLAEKDGANVLMALGTHDELPPIVESKARELIPNPYASPGASASPQDASSAYGGVTAVVTPGETEEAETVRQHLRTVPMNATVPTGWDPIFAMGCRQVTGQCP